MVQKPSHLQELYNNFCGRFHLEGHGFPTRPKPLDNQIGVKVKFQRGQFKKFKTFCKFQGHFDLEDQGQGHQF